MGRRPRRACRRGPGRGRWIAAAPDQRHRRSRASIPRCDHPGRCRRQRPRPWHSRGRRTRPPPRHLLRPHRHRSGPEHNPESLRLGRGTRLPSQSPARGQDCRPDNRRRTGPQYVRRLRHHPRALAPRRQERRPCLSPHRITGPSLDPIDSSDQPLPARQQRGYSEKNVFDGRFAPSPTGPLHLGNLRTALLAWLFARSAGARFLIRVEDLDRSRVRPGVEEAQLSDLRALGLDWDGPVLRQSERMELYVVAIAGLDADGLLYPCYCTRAEIRAAASAPHSIPASDRYPGICRDLTVAQRAEREASGRPPALRVRSQGARITFRDRLLGRCEEEVDDFVVRRNDGTPAYQLAVVFDDAAQGIGEVVRGADLADSTPRQILLARMLGLPAPRYAHVPLVLGPDRRRLAKRHGAVTLSERGEGPDEVRAWMARSLGLARVGEMLSPDDLIARFDPERLPREPTVWSPKTAV